MIKKNNQTIDKIYKGSTEIAKIYKGSTLVYENYKDIVATGNDIINITKAKAGSLNYLKAFGKCEQRRLPVGYTELASISGITNKAWFDTGIAGNNDNLRFVFSGYKGSSVAYTSFFANYVNESSNVTRLIASSGSNGIIAEVNRKSASSISTNSVNYLVAHTYELYKENGISILKVDGVQVDTMADSAGTANSTNIAINSSKINPSTPSSDVITTFQGNFQIYDGSTLIRNYVMAKRDSDNAVGMYDIVNNTFKISEGTDNFTAGAEAPTPSNPIPIWCNNGELKVRNKSGLPLGYQAVEYLESTGTQYLKLGVNDSNPNLEIETTFSDIGGSGYRYIVGCWSNDNNQNTVVYINGTNQIGAWVCKAFSRAAMIDTNITQKHIVKVNKDSYYLDGNLVTSEFTSGTERTGAELYAFKRNGTDGSSPQTTSISGKIYNISFKDNGVLIRNFIPARRKSDNVLGMYDTVTNIFITNAGTGTFTTGADVDDLEIYTDGTTETIEIHGKNLFDYSSIGTIKPDPSGTAEREGIIIKGLKAGTYTFSYKSNTSFTINYVRIANGVRIDGTPAPAITRSPFQITLTGEMDEIRFWVATTTVSLWRNVSDVQLELGSTATTYEPYFNGGNATAENLLSAGTYKDVQSVLDGTVTRKIGVKVLNGTENITTDTYGGYRRFVFQDSVGSYSETQEVVCSHYIFRSSGLREQPNSVFLASSGKLVIYISADQTFTTVSEFSAWLADQYNAGTPVIIVYPLATPTTETATAQLMNIQKGTNIIEVTEASLDGLGLEVKYKGK